MSKQLRIALCAILFVSTFLFAAEKEAVLFDFESPNQLMDDPKPLQFVPEHVTQGKLAGKVKLDKPFNSNFGMYAGTNMAGKWGDFDQFVMDVFVEGGPVKVMGWIRDAEGGDWWKRYNFDLKLLPGKRKVELSLGAFTRQNGKGNLDLKTINFVALTFESDDAKQPATIYLDNGRLVKGADELSFEGLRKFDFGPEKSALMPGFSRVTSATGYSKGTGFGWQPGGQFGRDFDMIEMLGRHRAPDDLCRDFCMPLRATFAVDVPNGKYRAWIMLGPPHNGWGPSFIHRKVTAEGKVVVDQEFTQETFEAHEYLFQDTEDLPGDDLWEKYINVLFKPALVDIDVADGQLDLDFNSFGQPWCCMVNALVIWPAAQEQPAQTWLASLNARRKDQYLSGHVETLPAAPSPYAGSADELARGFVRFVHSPDRVVNVNSVPTPDEVKTTSLELAAAPGEFEDGCFGIYPLKDCGVLKISVGDLAGPNGASIPASRLNLLVTRNKALNRADGYSPLPKYLDAIPENGIAIKPGVTRSFWLVAHVPENAAAGSYKGKVALSFSDGKSESIDVALTVWPIHLAEPGIPMGMFMMGPAQSYLAFDPSGKSYWNAYSDLLTDARAHGLTSIDPLISIPLTKFDAGKATINFTQADHFMELARAAGFTQEINGYGIDTGFASKIHAGLDYSAEAKRFGAPGYAELVKAYFDAVREHAKEKNWLPICFCLDDEYVIHPDSLPEKLAAHHRLLQENAPGFHFVAFDSAYYNLASDKWADRDKMVAALDTWGAGTHSPRDAEVTKKANHRLWLYNSGMNRFTFGTYMFFARKKYDVSGFFQWIYNGEGTYGNFYLASYNESHFGITYPSTRGLRSTPIWEQIRAGCDDHRYLETAWQLIEKAKAAGKDAQAAPLRSLIEDVFARLKFGNQADAVAGDGKADSIFTPQSMAEFRKKLAEQIVALQDVLK